MMRGIQVTLPPQAQARLDELNLIRDQALDALRSTQARINGLPLDTPAHITERLAKERDIQAAAHNVWHRVLSNVNQFLFTLRLGPDQAIQLVSIASSLNKGQSAKEAIVAVRAEIADNLVQQAKVRALPMKRSSKEEAVVSWLSRLAQSVRPMVGFDREGRPQVSFREDMINKTEALALVCWCLGPNGPIELLNAFGLDGEAEDDPNAVSPEERAHKLSELSAALLALEYKECVLVHNSDSSLPRPECDPRAFLMIRVVEREPEPQAAVA
jgi:hypothetical protein